MSRQIIVADSLKWLSGLRPKSIPNVVTGICDMDEINLDLPKYLDFFKKIANLIFSKTDPNGYAIFIQTDRKYQREWIDKSALLSECARQNGFKMVWHKIQLLRDVDGTDLHRPTYSHVLAYTVNGTTGAAFPDVFPVSKRLYKNGTPIEAAQRSLEFVKRYSKTPVVIDPFVGQGTIPAIANSLGMDAVGIDIDPKQAEIAETMFFGVSRRLSDSK